VAGVVALPERGRSQAVRAQLMIREAILSGALRPGERIAELDMVERTGVSRTPVRAALVRLEQEGLLEPLVGGGFTVRSFSEADVFDAIEVRGALEGLATRFAAERGAEREAMEAARGILAEIDDLLGCGAIDAGLFSRYVALNARFHDALWALSGSDVLRRQLERANNAPFAGPSAFVALQAALPEARLVLTLAQDQHRSTIEAIAAREGARAEALMREHARLAARNLRLALRDSALFERLPGAALIRRRGA